MSSKILELYYILLHHVNNSCRSRDFKQRTSLVNPHDVDLHCILTCVARREGGHVKAQFLAEQCGIKVKTAIVYARTIIVSRTIYSILLDSLLGST